MNHYTSYICTGGRDLKQKSLYQDANFIIEADSAWRTSPTALWLKVVPQGFREMFLWRKKEYNNPPVFITENGYSDLGELNDIDRIKYFEVFFNMQ